MNRVLQKLHILLMPFYDWKNKPIKMQASVYFEKLRTQRRLSALLLLIKMGVLWTLNTIFYLPGLVLSLSRFRVLCVDLSQFGTTFYLDAKIKEQILISPRLKFIVPINPYLGLSNDNLLALYSRHVLYADKILSKLLLFPFYQNRFLSVNTKNIDGSESLAHVIVRKYRQKVSQKPLVSLSREQIQVCEDKLREVGIVGKYVVVHVRDAGHYQERWNSLRNADLNTYFEAIQHLINLGYQVLRIGSPRAKALEKRFASLSPAFFDYAKSTIKSELMDIYLISHAAFFLGTSSGPQAVAGIFHVPVLTTNHVAPGDAFTLQERDMTIFKKYVQDNGRYLNLVHLFSKQLRFNPSGQTYEDWGLQVLDNSPQEILDATKEFCERFENPSLPSPLNDQLRSRMTTAFPEIVWRPGKFSETFLESYLEGQNPF